MKKLMFSLLMVGSLLGLTACYDSDPVVTDPNVSYVEYNGGYGYWRGPVFVSVPYHVYARHYYYHYRTYPVRPYRYHR